MCVIFIFCVCLSSCKWPPLLHIVPRWIPFFLAAPTRSPFAGTHTPWNVVSDVMPSAIYAAKEFIITTTNSCGIHLPELTLSLSLSRSLIGIRRQSRSERFGVGFCNPHQRSREGRFVSWRGISIMSSKRVVHATVHHVPKQLELGLWLYRHAL